MEKPVVNCILRTVNTLSKRASHMPFHLPPDKDLKIKSKYIYIRRSIFSTILDD